MHLINMQMMHSRKTTGRREKAAVLHSFTENIFSWLRLQCLETHFLPGGGDGNVY